MVQCTVVEIVVVIETATKPHVLLTFGQVHNPLPLPRKTASEHPTVVQTPSVFDLEMCFAPQRRAFFRHLNFQKWSEVGVFSTF